MNFKVQRLEGGGDSIVFSVSGRIQAQHTETLAQMLGRVEGRVTLDLKEVILVDRDAMRFLAACQARGVELRNCPAYVREWIRQEGARTYPDSRAPHDKPI